MTRRLGWCLLGLLLAADLHAAGINTNVALPVHRGGFIYRTQLRYARSSDDPTPLDRDVRTYRVPNVLLYGATERTTLFGIVPYVSRSVELSSDGSREESQVQGLGDLTFLVRQTIYARDAVQRTSRLALIGGLEIPSGKEELSSHSTDFILGGVYTLQTGRHELDADVLYKVNTEGRSVELGDEIRYDIAYELRVTPWEWPDRGTPSQIYLVIEANGHSTRRTATRDGEIADSGGTVLFLSPGIQFVTRRVIYEASVQVPAVQNLNGDQLETAFVATAGIRVQF